MLSTQYLLLLAISWACYAIVHSLLASHACKNWCLQHYPRYYPAYRLGYNILAGLLLVPPLWLTWSYQGTVLWHWPAGLGRVADAAALAAVAGFVWTMRAYDSGEFLGLSQLRQKSATVDDQAPMHLCTVHRFVRHPWYFFGLVIIWSREMNAAFLVSAIILTLYLIIGSRLEEKKLVTCYGEQYDHYRQRVPGLIPLPWRYLSRQEAKQIRAGAKK